MHRRAPAPALARLLGGWHRGGTGYLALAAALRALVVDGRLPPGTRLPSERALADALGVSRTTVTAALDLLRAQGFAGSRRGSGTWTALPVGDGARPDGDGPARPDEHDLTVAALPAPALVADLAAEAAADLGAHLGGIGYGAFGLPVLRAEIARHLSARGLETAPDEVLVTQGALHAWSLILRAFAAPGDRVVVETPTYPAALDAVLAQGARPVGVAVDDDGWDLAQLDHALRAPAPRLVYTIPDFHNPTGLLAPAGARVELLRAARRAGALVVADEISADLALDAGPLPPRLGALADARHVLTIGSLSKSCWAGVRTGWIRADRRLLARIAAARGAQDSASPVLDGLLAARLLPRLDAIVAARRPLLVERRDALLDALATALPTWRVPRPAGGLWTWAELPAPCSTALVAAARPAGLRLAAGGRFSASGGLETRLRLPFVLAPDDLRDVVARLAEVAARVERGAGRVASRGAPAWVV